MGFCIEHLPYILYHLYAFPSWKQVLQVILWPPIFGLEDQERTKCNGLALSATASILVGCQGQRSIGLGPEFVASVIFQDATSSGQFQTLVPGGWKVPNLYVQEKTKTEK